MKTLAFSLAAAAAAAIVTGCVAYPVDSYHHRGDGSAYRDEGRSYDRYDRDDHHERSRDRDRVRDNERGDRRDRPDRP
jgi:hypothetical protein